MRGTVTLDKDAERLLRNAMHSRCKSFKDVLNDPIRVGLGARPARRERSPFFVIKARAMGLSPRIDPASLNKLADALEVEAVVARAVAGRCK